PDEETLRIRAQVAAKVNKVDEVYQQHLKNVEGKSAPLRENLAEVREVTMDQLEQEAKERNYIIQSDIKTIKDIPKEILDKAREFHQLQELTSEENEKRGENIANKVLKD